jgi:hypothetical protein
MTLQQKVCFSLPPDRNTNLSTLPLNAISAVLMCLFTLLFGNVTVLTYYCYYCIIIINEFLLLFPTVAFMLPFKYFYCVTTCRCHMPCNWFLNTSVLMAVNFSFFLSFRRLCSYLDFVGCFFILLCENFLIGHYAVE